LPIANWQFDAGKRYAGGEHPSAGIVPSLSFFEKSLVLREEG
jgi:hypothetical protein